MFIEFHLYKYVYDLEQDCSISIANALEIPPSCTISHRCGPHSFTDDKPQQGGFKSLGYLVDTSISHKILHSSKGSALILQPNIVSPVTHYSDMTWASRGLKAWATQFFVQQHVQADINIAIKFLHHCSFLKGTHQWQPCGFPSQRTSNAESVPMWWCRHVALPFSVPMSYPLWSCSRNVQPKPEVNITPTAPCIIKSSAAIKLTMQGKLIFVFHKKIFQ